MIRKLAGVLLLCGFGAAGSCALDERDVQLAFPLFGDAGTQPGLSLSPTVAQLAVTPTTVDLGWVATGFSARTSVRIANSGGAPLPVPIVGLAAGSDPDFSIIQNQCLAELAPGDRCEIRVQVIPSRSAELHAVLHVEGSGGLAADVALSAEGLAAGELVLTPAPGSFADFGSVSLGATGQAAFTLVNPTSTASGPIEIRSNRPEFVVLPPTGAAGECVMGATSLVNGESCALRLAFTPTERGPLEATLTTRSEAAGSVSATLSGRGLAPGVLVTSTAAIDFDGVVLGDGAQRSVRLSNAGDEPLTLVGAGLAPAGVEGFAILNSDCGAARVLAGDDACDVLLEFRPPRADEEMTAELQAEVVEGQQRQVVALRGIGLEQGALAVAPVTAGEEDFGSVQVGSSLVRVFQIANPQSQPSGVLALSTSEGFTLESPPGPGECSESTSIVDGASCTVRVRFSPTRRAAYQGALTVTSALAGAKGLSLVGRGIVPAALEATGEINFGRVFTDSSATRTLSVRNSGDEPMAPPSLEITSANPELAAAFSYENGCVAPLGLDEACDIQVRLSPTRAVPHSANLHLVSTPGGAATVLLLAEALAPGSLELTAAPGTTDNFGDVPIGAPATRNFVLTNPGNVASGPVTITSDNNRFEVLAGDCNPAGSPGLVDGSSCSFGVRFTPDSSLEVIANLSAQSPGAGQTGIEIRGRGRRAANLVASAGNRDLGRAYIGQETLSQPENQFSWTVTNNGDLASGVLSVTNDNPTEFIVSNDTCSQASVPGAGTCSMVIRFRPGTTGTRAGRVVVLETGSGRSAPIALTGVGDRLAQLGQSCVNATCAAGTCTRNVCCDRACDGTCQVCSTAGVCSDQSGQEPCGNGNGRCFGVNRCLLPNALACGQDSDCGRGNCERRLNGQGPNDRICCQQDCEAIGQQCNAQGQCQAPALGDGALCGRSGDAPCAQGLECKACPGGGNRCTPAAACCGGCTNPYVCVDGDECDCPLQANGQRQIDCGGGLCIQRRDGACCPGAPQQCTAARPNCDPADNLCKQCLNASQCAGANRACNGGVCACAANTRDCGGGRCIPSNGCCETCNGGRTCNTGTGICECPEGQQFVNNQCRLNPGQVCTPGAQLACASTFCEPAGGGNNRCCSRDCTGLEQCSNTGSCTCSGAVCSNQCVNLQTDSNNCGVCGRTCRGGTCTAGRCDAVTLADGYSNLGSVMLSSTHVYWSARSVDGLVNGIHRVPKSQPGQDAPVRTEGLGSVGGLAIGGNQLYIVNNHFNTDLNGDSFPESLRVWRANLDGTGFIAFSDRGAESGNEIANLIISGTSVYYDRSSGTIYRAPLLSSNQPGEGADVVFESAFAGPMAVVGDCAFYVLRFEGNRIMRDCSPTQAGAQHYLGAGAVAYASTSVDATHLFVDDASRGIVRIAAGAGGGFDVLVTPRPAGLSGPASISGFAVDGSSIYYIATGGAGCPAIFRVGKAPGGAAPVQLFPAPNQCAPTSQLSTPSTLAVDNEAVYWSNDTGTIMKVAK